MRKESKTIIMQDKLEKLSEINFVEKDKVQAILKEVENASIGDYLESIDHMVIGINPIEIVRYGQYYWDYDNEKGSNMGYSAQIENNDGIIIYYDDAEKISLKDYILCKFESYEDYPETD